MHRGGFGGAGGTALPRKKWKPRATPWTSKSGNYDYSKCLTISQTGSTKGQEDLEEFLFSSIPQKKSEKVFSFKIKKVEHFIMLNRHKLVMYNEVHSFFFEGRADVGYIF